ncbi:MAG: 2-hydroxyacid dehydrogenase [Burkholderiales bacterium]
MTKTEILVLTRIYAPTLAALEQEYTVHKLWAAADPNALLQKIAPNIRGVVTTSLTGFRHEQFAALPNLEILACFGIGHGAIDLSAARDHGVTVTNTPDSIAESVADLGAGLIIAVMRRICETDRFVRAGNWRKSLPPLGRELTGKTCGIVGLGKIGLCIAKRVQAFGMSVCYYGPREKNGVGYPYYADVEALAKHSDCLVVTCPLTDQTRNLVDVRILRALGSNGYLINVARGPIVDEEALITALTTGEIAGAGLDVFWNEPDVPSELIEMKQVVMVPHIGSSTQEIREQRGAHLLANLRAHFSGNPVPNPLR